MWTKFALQLKLFPQQQIFFEQFCVTHAFVLRFVLWQTTSNVDLWNKTYFKLHHFMFFLGQKHGVFMTHNHLFLSDKIASTFFVFQHRKSFELNGTPTGTGFSLTVARVFSFSHHFAERTPLYGGASVKSSMFRHHVRCT